MTPWARSARPRSTRLTRTSPAGRGSWHWHSPEPIASYLIGNSIGSYDLLARTSTLTGIQYFQAQASAITATRKALNKIAMDSQEDLTTFQTRFAGAFPFTTDGVVVGIPDAGFEEEMQTKITFQGGVIGGGSGTSLGTFAHENFHQWFGDNVSEGAFRLTFWKEGWATVGQYLLTARGAATAAGGLDTPAGNAAFDNSLISRFNTNYGTTSSSAWVDAPSNPTVGNLFSTASTYTRPGTAYLALHQILDSSISRPDSDRWIGAMKQIQHDFGGHSITEAQLENVFHQWLPNQSAACHTKLDEFFAQWFDTAYPTPNNATNKPQITGPGLNGPDHFYDDATDCARADQAIDFAPLPDKASTDPDFTVSATSDSGLPVSFAAAGQCTISGNTVHLTSQGSCTITASQAGDAVFKPAPNVDRTFAIHSLLLSNSLGEGGSQTVQYSDALSPDVTITATDTGSPGSALSASASGLPVGLSLAVVSTSDDATRPGARTWKVAGNVSDAPGTFPVSVTVSDDAGREATTTFTIIVSTEDADATYTGDELVFTAPGGSSANVQLRATIRDSAAIPASGDTAGGDIRNATATFSEGGTTLCGPLPVTLIDGALTTGTAGCTASLGVGQHVIDIAVAGYYSGTGSAMVTVAQPDGSFVTGGGHLVIGTSAGSYAADAGSKMDFGLDVKYKGKAQDLKGQVTVTFWAGGRKYELKSKLIASLGIALRTPSGDPCTAAPSPTCLGLADVRGTATLTDVSKPTPGVKPPPKPHTPVLSDLTLRVTFTDQGKPGKNGDTIGITVWNGSTLIFSSAWNGASTVEVPLAGGDVVVH